MGRRIGFPPWGETLAEPVDTEGAADSAKLSPPAHGLPATQTRAAQERIIELIGDVAGARR